MLCRVRGFLYAGFKMSYLVLARKWRPQNFDQVIGQDDVVKTLKQALTSERVAHAFLFSGGRGIGKTTLARIMAKSLVCDTGITDKPCQTCINCESVTNGNSVDVIEIDGASNTSVDDIRQLREAARYQPSSCRFKIFIIDEVHMLSNNAFNALLKILEEPPEYVKFIFATTESHKIPVTVISRCQRYDFKRFSNSDITKQLSYIFKEEQINISEEGINLIAKASDGAMRDALSLSDQIISFAGNKPSLDDIYNILGFINRKLVMDLVRALIDKQIKESLSIIDGIFEKGFDLSKLLKNLAKEFRNLAVAGFVGSVEDTDELSVDEITEINELAQKCNKKDMQRLFAMAIDACDKLIQSANPRLTLDLAILTMVDRPEFSDVQTISHAISKLENISKNTNNLMPYKNVEDSQIQLKKKFQMTESNMING